MIRKNGFTLIELLAVIVILAIISLIATPIVMSTIESTNKESLKISSGAYEDKIQTAIMEEKLNNNITLYDNCKKDINVFNCNISDFSSLDIELNGKTPKSGNIYIKNDKVEGFSLFYDKYKVIKSEGELVINDTTTSDAIQMNDTTVKFLNDGTYGNVSFTCDFRKELLPEEATITDAGMILIAGSLPVGESLTFNSANATKISIPTTTSVRYSIKITNSGGSNVGKRTTARGFIKYNLNGEEFIIYSERTENYSVRGLMKQMAQILIEDYNFDYSTIPITDSTKEVWNQNWDDVWKFVVDNWDLRYN